MSGKFTTKLKSHKKGDRKFFTIVFFILVLVLAVGLITPVVIQNKSDNWDDELSTQINEIQSSVIRLYKAKEDKLLGKRNELKESLSLILNTPYTSYRELIKLVNEQKFSGFSLQVLAPNGRIIAWNESIAIPQEDIFPLNYPAGHVYFYNTELVTYLTITDTVHIEHDIFYFILSFPVEKLYSLQNPFYEEINFTNELSEKFYTQFEIEFTPFAEKSKDGRKYSFDLLNNKGTKIGIVTFVKPSLSVYVSSVNQLSSDIQAVLVVLAFLVAAFGFRKDFRELKYKSLRFIFLVIYLVLLRILLFVLVFPARFIGNSITDPALFSSTFAWGIVKSPVEFSITVFIFLVIAVYAFRNILIYVQEDRSYRLKSRFVSGALIVLLTVLFFISVRAVAASIKSVIFDSTIRYFREPELFPDFPSFVMNLNTLCFGVGAVLLLCGFVMLIRYHLSIVLRKDSDRNHLVLFLVFLLPALLFFLQVNNPLITPLIMFIILVFIFILSYHFYKKGLSPYNYVFAALIASVISITLLNYFNLKLERQSLKTIAFEINRPNDNLMRFMLDETLNSAANDQKIINYFSRKNTNYDALSFLIWSNSSLQRESLQSSVSVFDKNRKETGNFAVGLNPEMMLYDFANALKNKPAISDFSGNDFENLFTAVIPVSERGITLGYITASAAYDLSVIGRRGIPDFLESTKNVITSVLDIEQLKIFEFIGSRVNRVYGDLYPSRDHAGPIINAEFSPNGDAWVMLNINEEEYQSYLLKIPVDEEDKITAVLLREKQFAWNLFNFFKIFVIHSLLVLILLVLIFIIGVRKINYTFRAKLLIAFLVISIIPVVVLALYNRQVVQERSRTAVITELNERLNYLENHIRVQRERHLQRDLNTIFRNAGKELGISFGAYENTEQIYNSREKFYSAGLFSSTLNSQAHYHLNYLSYREFLSKERVENFEYDSFYKMIEIDDKNIILGVNDAFNKVDIIYTTMDMDVFLFGIYSFAVLIIIIISTILANNISAPIRRLTKATISVARGDLNVEVESREKGELKDLIEGFNSMTRELQKNQIELAEMEREAAWKEMAKQVAHEIKNPLTPLKLAVQQLVASYKDKSDLPAGQASKFETVFEKVTQTILGQIENLSSIATEFSRFAKMPSLKIEETDLLNILKDTVNLFVDENVKISIFTRLESAKIEADINQLRRMIINLVRNSIQAGANEIEIKIQSEDQKYMITFSDNGEGIPEHYKDKIFDSNFTTKEKGMGLGLKLAKRFLEGINGSIELQDASGNGTVFRITIPAL